MTDHDPAMRAELQRRTLRVLTAGQVIGAAALAAAVTVGAFVVQDILGQETPWAGLATATVTTGTAVMSQVLSRRMQRAGRRVGLAAGYALAAAGGVIAAVGVELASLPVFLIGLFLFGNGQSANLLARYAATDLALSEERGRAMSTIVFASTFGAVFGPLLIGPAEYMGEEWFGIDKYTGPWLFASAFFVGAAVNTGTRLRPDPLLVARSWEEPSPDDAPSTRPRLTRTITAMLRRPAARLALAAMVVSQVTMVAVMAMTPVHLKLHGHEGVSQYVVSLHIAGMYAFSPLVGRHSDRHGRVATIRVGAVLLVVSAVVAAASGDVEQLLFPSLWLLGLGWNFGLIGGSSLLVDATPAPERVATQGAADLLMSFCGGMGGFASGFVRRAVGFHVLAAGATVAAAALLVLVVSPRSATGIRRDHGDLDEHRTRAAAGDTGR